MLLHVTNRPPPPPAALRMGSAHVYCINRIEKANYPESGTWKTFRRTYHVPVLLLGSFPREEEAGPEL